MQEKLRESISHLRYATDISELNKGFSDDQKYVIDQQFLLRVFPLEEAGKRLLEFETINKLNDLSKYVPKGLEFRCIKELNKAYMVLTYLPGIDAEVGLRKLTKEEQYATGVLAGNELKKLHTLSAPLDHPEWYHVKAEKIKKYISAFENLDLDKNIMDMLDNYIGTKLHLMKERPNRFQHDDFHPSNLLIHNNSFAGIIDFQRMDWGDPIHDLQKLGFFSKRISIEFTNGILDGYHKGKPIADSFWELYSFYSAVHIVSALVWGWKRGQSQFDLLLAYALDVIEDHDNFNSIIPNWYQKQRI